MHIFVTQLPKEINALTQAYQKKDYVTLKSLAHRLKVTHPIAVCLC